MSILDIISIVMLFILVGIFLYLSVENDRIREEIYREINHPKARNIKK